MDEQTYTSHVGTKFFPDGRFRPYPGVTVICRIDENRTESRVLGECQARFKGPPFSGKFAFLPQSSFHMTAIELVSDQRREAVRWSKHLPLNAPMAEVNAFMERAWSEIEPPGQIQMRVSNCKVSTVIVVGLEPFTSEQARVLRGFRDEAAEKTGVRKPGHDTYRFHITLAYKLVVLDDEENARLQEEIDAVNRLLAEKMPTIELPQPELMFYHDMSTFLTTG